MTFFLFSLILLNLLLNKKFKERGVLGFWGFGVLGCYMFWIAFRPEIHRSGHHLLDPPEPHNTKNMIKQVTGKSQLSCDFEPDYRCDWYERVFLKKCVFEFVS